MAIDVRNPRTGLVDYRFEAPSSAELSANAARLRARQPEWESGGLGARLAALTEWRGVLDANRGELLDVLVHDTGRLVESGLEVDAVLRSIERWCRIAPDLLADEPLRPASIPTVEVGQGLRPYALAGVISPWNFP